MNSDCSPVKWHREMRSFRIVEADAKLGQVLCKSHFDCSRLPDNMNWNELQNNTKSSLT